MSPCACAISVTRAGFAIKQMVVVGVESSITVLPWAHCIRCYSRDATAEPEPCAEV